MKHVFVVAVTFVLSFVCAEKNVQAAPGYDQSRQDLEWVMEYLIQYFPGVWDSAPQVWFEENIHMPSNGEGHEHWHRTFARIEAPQIGDVVFYGQINVEGRDGPIISGSQVLYHAVIDESLGAVNIFGQGPRDPENFENLHERPELWGRVEFRDRPALNCDWLWRRDGDQIFGVLQGNTPDKQTYGPGTCSFISQRTGEEFRADAEWVLTPEQLWLYDNNWSAGMLFLGREDQTHIRLHRARPYICKANAAQDTEEIGHDRGFKMELTSGDGKDLEALLLRAEYPAADGFGSDDLLRLMLTDAESGESVAVAEAKPMSENIALAYNGITVTCDKTDQFAPLHR
jgi:hypothetical protein